MPGRIIPGRTVGERPQLPRAGSGAGAWCETWLCPGGRPAAVNPSKGCPVNDLQSAARFRGTAPSCALLGAGAGFTAGAGRSTASCSRRTRAVTPRTVTGARSHDDRMEITQKDLNLYPDLGGF